MRKGLTPDDIESKLKENDVESEVVDYIMSSFDDAEIDWERLMCALGVVDVVNLKTTIEAGGYDKENKPFVLALTLSHVDPNSLGAAIIDKIQKSHR